MGTVAKRAVIQVVAHSAIPQSKRQRQNEFELALSDLYGSGSSGNT